MAEESVASMNRLTMILFIHVLGMLGLFGALSVEAVSVMRLRQSTSDAELIPWVALYARVSRVHRVSLGILVLTGAYLTRGLMESSTGTDGRFWGLGWLITSMAATMLFAIAGGISDRRVRPASKQNPVAALPGRSTGRTIR